MATEKISSAKANEMIADLKERLSKHLADLAIVDDIIRSWLNDHIGITNIGMECSPLGTILDTSEGIV